MHQVGNRTIHQLQLSASCTNCPQWAARLPCSFCTCVCRLLHRVSLRSTHEGAISHLKSSKALIFTQRQAISVSQQHRHDSLCPHYLELRRACLPVLVLGSSCQLLTHTQGFLDAIFRCRCNDPMFFTFISRWSILYLKVRKVFYFIPLSFQVFFFSRTGIVRVEDSQKPARETLP